MQGADSKRLLRQALERALEGDHGATQHLLSGISPKELSLLEKSAWLQLQHWEAEEPLRALYPKYAEASLRRIDYLLAKIAS